MLLKGGALDPTERRVIREHPIVGDALCAGLRSLRVVRPIVRHHHERLDGTGYPDGLRNGRVPLLAQIIGLVDVFDALTTERPYHSAMPRDNALEILCASFSHRPVPEPEYALQSWHLRSTLHGEVRQESI